MSTATPNAGIGTRRVLGRLSGRRPGPTVIVLGGIHGNEPSGIVAAMRVHDRLAPHEAELCGDAVFIAGNLEALERDRRYIDLDLNRQWTREKVASLLATDREPAEPAEHREQRELIEIIAELVAVARGPLYFIDLHTSSSVGPAFLTVGDTLRNRRFARAFPLPLILGLEEQIDGALLELLNDHGFVTLGVEAGQHRDPSSTGVHEAVVWLALDTAGLLGSAYVGDRSVWHSQLAALQPSLPRIVEVRFRHPVKAGDGFRMEPDFQSFQPVRRGQIVANDHGGPIRAPEDGLMLLPLYQGQGDDGFFLAREVRPFWLRVSALMRRAGLSRTVPLLPGVKQHPAAKEVLIVDTRVARLYPLEIFHLLGFRKLRFEDDALVVSRRRYDLDPPARVSFP